MVHVNEPGIDGKIKQCKADLRELSMRKEILWRQRAKTTWLNKGDCNSRYFHASATIRKRRNCIWRIKNTTDLWCTGKAMDAVFLAYFCGIFTSTDQQGDGLVIFDVISKKLSD